MVEFIQQGGLDLIEKAIKIHVNDNYLSVLLPKLMRVILGETRRLLRFNQPKQQLIKAYFTISGGSDNLRARD